ncbi:MAG TPA: hypothetical protein VK837_08545 [Longimicrobiales bacterium]|nr:hypothetical protein [Longimicrobiales bacterium]
MGFPGTDAHTHPRSTTRGTSVLATLILLLFPCDAISAQDAASESSAHLVLSPSPAPCTGGADPAPLVCRRPTWAGAPRTDGLPIRKVARPTGQEETRDGSDAGVLVGTLAGAAILGLVSAYLGHEIDRALHEDEPSEDPGLVGAYSGLFLGTGYGGVLGAHIGSRGAGSPWLPLGIATATIPAVLLELELGALPPLVAVLTAVAMEMAALEGAAEGR